MANKSGIVLTSPKPFEDGLAFWDKGYVLFGTLGFVIGFFKNGLTGGSMLMLLAVFLCWIVKANVALIKWRKLRSYEFMMDRQLSLEELTGNLVASLTPYGLRVDIVNQRPSVSYRNIKIQVHYNENGTFSMPWSQSPGWFFLDYRYITSYYNTVAIMSIVGYHVQKLCAAEADLHKQDSVSENSVNGQPANLAIELADFPKPKRKKIPVVLMMAAAALIAVVGLFSSQDNSYISAVKNGHPNAYPEQTYGEAFEQFFGKPEWTYFESTDGQNIVEFSGDCTYLDTDVTVTMQFTLEDEGETFEVTYLDMNGAPQNQLLIASLMMKVFEDSTVPEPDQTSLAETALPSMEETQELLQSEEQTEPETASETEHELDSEYIFFESNSRLLTEEEIYNLSSDELRLAVNEIYARHGRTFADTGLQEYFNSKSWYQGTISPDQFNEKILNDFEKENARMLSERRTELQSADVEPQTFYGLYECSSNSLNAELEVGVYTDDGTEYIRLTGSSSDGSGFGEFFGTVVSTKAGNYTAVDESGNVIDVYFDGTGNAHVSDENMLGEGNFPGFTGTYKKSADFSNVG